MTYDGKEHSVSGFTSAPDGADFSAVTVGAKGTNVGTYDAKFAEDTVGTVDATAKYIVTEANDGKLTITPVGGIVVTITGNTDSRPYSGAEQSVTGYTVSTNNPLYTEADFTFTGTATAKGTDADSYAMGLTPEQFENTNPNFEKVTFIVFDGKNKDKMKGFFYPAENLGRLKFLNVPNVNPYLSPIGTNQIADYQSRGYTLTQTEGWPTGLE